MFGIMSLIRACATTIKGKTHKTSQENGKNLKQQYEANNSEETVSLDKLINMAVPTIRLSTGRKMPIFGLGMWLSKPGEAADSVRCALSHGYRLIDTAACYFNEQELGKVLDEEFIKPGKLKEKMFSLLQRYNLFEQIMKFIKLWCTHNRAKEVEEQLRESLTKLRTSYVDLYLIHMPTSFDYEMKNPDTTDSLEELWTGMEGVYRKGLTKAIGVSNFSINQIERVQQSASIKIHNVQTDRLVYLYAIVQLKLLLRSSLRISLSGELVVAIVQY
ncbi:hypothetical protein DINM_001606 [Dirofilaria immitis]|nr:hypothetical protein [Dirofilaria immitis]